MGRPKLALPFGPETMLQRTVRILGSVVGPIVVVAAPGQNVPLLAAHVLLARDEQPHLGPLGGLIMGLRALEGRAAAAYVSACDVPLLRPEFVRRVIGLLDEYDLVIPKEGERHHPLAAVYRTHLHTIVAALIAEGRLRPVFLLERCHARVVDVEQLRPVDPALDSLRNTNTPEEYRAALAAAGLPQAEPD